MAWIRRKIRKNPTPGDVHGDAAIGATGRFRFPPAGTRRRRRGRGARVFRKDGVIVPPGMLIIAKQDRRERAANRRAREAVGRALERDLADVLARFRESITFDQAQAAVFAGDARVIVNASSPNNLEAELAVAITERMEDALGEGARIGLRFAPPILEGVPVTLATQAAIAAVERSAGLAALGLAQQTQAGIAEVLGLGLTDQLAPVDVARRVGEIAGLTPQGVRSVQNFRRTLTRRLAPIPDALTPEVQRVIGQEVGRFRDRLVLNRGRTIAETETQNAITAGERAFYQRGVADGVVPGEALFKTWRTVQDLRVCPICEPLHGQTIRFGELFQTSVGPKVGPTAHPRCRCYLEYGELDPSSGVPPRRDRGPDVAEEQARARAVDADALREDLSAATSRRDRTARRLARLDPNGNLAAELEATLEGLDRAAARLRARLGAALEARLQEVVVGAPAVAEDLATPS